jgi:hypothetical protein
MKLLTLMPLVVQVLGLQIVRRPSVAAVGFSWPFLVPSGIFQDKVKLSL